MSLQGYQSSFDISGRRVGRDEPCLVIAEAGVNHFGSLEKAYALVDLAVNSGADVVKFQHFKTDKLVGPSAPDWRERLRSKEMSDDQMRRIRDYADKQGILFMCTGHDEEALDFLDKELDVPAFKIGSGEVGNLPWLCEIARRGKPIILSTGLYELSEIEQTAVAMAEAGSRELALLHCITSYPTDPADVNLAVMRQISEFFPGPVGYSDHTAGTAVPLAAVALGAIVLEKHITIDRDVPNAQDWKVSCDPSNLADFLRDIREIEAARGGNAKVLASAERDSLTWASKSLAARRPIRSGEVLTDDAIISQRPGDGMAPTRIDELLGKCARRDIAIGDKFSPDMVE